MICQRNNCGGRLRDVSAPSIPVKATMCRICGDYKETDLAPVKPLPAKVMDKAGAHREAVLAVTDHPLTKQPLEHPCIAPGCTERYSHAKMPLCQRHNAVYYSWLQKAILKDNKNFTPAPFIEVDGVWQVNQERIRWENERNQPRYRALTRMIK